MGDRWQAAQDFRKIQCAKTTIISWLRDGNVPEASDNSDVPGCGASDEESSGLGCERYDSASVSDEAPEEMAAAGIRQRASSSSPSEAGSEEEVRESSLCLRSDIKSSVVISNDMS